MSALVNRDWRPMQLSELFVMYQAVLLETWHHTANLKGCFAGGKNTTYESLHPYIASTKSGMKIPSTSAIISSLDDGNDDFLSQMLDGVDYPDDIEEFLP